MSLKAFVHYYSKVYSYAVFIKIHDAVKLTLKKLLSPQVWNGIGERRQKEMSFIIDLIWESADSSIFEHIIG